MADKKGFDLANLLKDVPKLDTWLTNPQLDTTKVI